MFEKHSDSPPLYDDSEKHLSSRGFHESAEFLSDKAVESLRAVTIQTETHAAHDSDDLKSELKGKRIWKVGGVGMWAYEKDDHHEQEKRRIWREFGEKHGKDEWMKAARARTDWYNKGGVSP